MKLRIMQIKPVWLRRVTIVALSVPMIPFSIIMGALAFTIGYLGSAMEAWRGVSTTERERNSLLKVDARGDYVFARIGIDRLTTLRPDTTPEEFGKLVVRALQHAADHVIAGQCEHDLGPVIPCKVELCTRDREYDDRGVDIGPHVCAQSGSCNGWPKIQSI